MLTIKKGDTRHAVEATLSIGGKAQDLTDCQVSFSMSNGVTGVAIVTDALSGKVAYPLQAENVDTAGHFRGEFKVIYPDGRTAHFPNDRYIPIHILENLRSD